MVNLCLNMTDKKKRKNESHSHFCIVFQHGMRSKQRGSFGFIAEAKVPKAYNMRLVTRLSSQGQFNYGGRLVSPNPTFDLNFTYDRKGWGIQVSKRWTSVTGLRTSILCWLS